MRRYFATWIARRRKLSFAIAFAAVSVLGVFGVVTTEASASTVTSVTTTLVDKHTHFCLDGNSSGVVYSMKCNGGNYQKWIVRHYSSGNYYTFQSVQTKHCLYAFWIRTGYLGIRTAPCNSSDTVQLFYMYYPSVNYDVIQTLSANYVLDSNWGTGTVGSVYATPPNGGDWQHWAGPDYF